MKMEPGDFWLQKAFWVASQQITSSKVEIGQNFWGLSSAAGDLIVVKECGKQAIWYAAKCSSVDIR